MQRTVASTRFIYVENVLNDDGSLASEVKSITIHETDEKKAFRKAVKEIGYFKPLKVEIVNKTYFLDDDIFFKYAVALEK